MVEPSEGNATGCIRAQDLKEKQNKENGVEIYGKTWEISEKGGVTIKIS